MFSKYLFINLTIQYLHIYILFNYIIKIPRLMVRSFYPFDASHGFLHIAMLAFQFYWLFICMVDANSLDVLFCSWLLFACEQLQHLKAIMKPLMELSATLDTVVPNSSELFKVSWILLKKKNKSMNPNLVFLSYLIFEKYFYKGWKCWSSARYNWNCSTSNTSKWW